MIKIDKRLIFALVLIFLILVSFEIKKFTSLGNVVKVHSSKLDNLKDNCDCIEQKRYRCMNGFEYNEKKGFCIDEENNRFTKPIK